MEIGGSVNVLIEDVDGNVINPTSKEVQDSLLLCLKNQEVMIEVLIGLQKQNLKQIKIQNRIMAEAFNIDETFSDVNDKDF